MAVSRIMECRYDAIQENIAGYDSTGVNLVSLTNEGIKATSGTDDLGSYYYITEIADMLNLSAGAAVNVFYLFFLVLGLLLAFYSFYKMSYSIKHKVIASVYLVIIGLASYKVFDVYVFNAIAVLCSVPPLLLLRKKQSTNKFYLIILFTIFLGLLGGFSNLVRSHSAIPLLIFYLGIVLSIREFSIVRKLVLLCFFFISFLLPKQHMNSAIEKRDNYLTTNSSAYHEVKNRHVFWHSVYIGLGYISNSHGIAYDDAVAIEKVKEVDKEIRFASKEYEEALKNEYFKMLKADLKFVFESYLAKLGIVAILFILIMNYALLLKIRRLRFNLVDMLFLASIAFGAIAPILVMPRFSYLLGFIVLSSFYAIYIYESIGDE